MTIDYIAILVFYDLLIKPHIKFLFLYYLFYLIYINKTDIKLIRNETIF